MLMRVLFFWEQAGLSLDRANPYGGLMAKAMSEIGVELRPGYPEQLCESWLEENRTQIDVLHLHWPSILYSASDLNEQMSLCTKLVSNLARARSLGYKIVWTMHNLYPHDSLNPDLDRLARLAIIQLATAVIVHCNHARELVRQHFFRNTGIFTIPHGHFIDPYPNTVTRSEARQQLGITEEKFVFLFFGNVRPNKGVEKLLEAFANIPDQDALLLIAAKVYSDYGASLAEAAKQSSRITVHTSSFFANEDFQVFLNAADVVVLPFLDILTSGSAITALSFLRPVIVPAIGCLPELIDSTMGALYNPNQPGALEQAMQGMKRRDLESCRQAICERLKSLSWDLIARQTLQAINKSVLAQ
jgi:glycosyltransferase involved in cell wall biosynthesis